MSDSHHDDLDTLHRGNRGRTILLIGALTMLALAAWFLLRSDEHGEPELAHRVLVVGASETDLASGIEGAGFDADQEGWVALEAELGAGFDLDTLLLRADERGYGFLAIVFGPNSPWTPEQIEAGAPEHSEVAVLSIGALQSTGETRVQFASVEAGIEFAQGLRRAHALRLALYNHPDLLHLWDDPSPEQLTLRTQIGPLPDRLVSVKARVERQREALASWPTELPDDVVGKPWLGVEGLATTGGVLVSRTQEHLYQKSPAVLEQNTDDPEQVWLPSATFHDPESVSSAPALDMPAIIHSNDRWSLSPDAHMLVAETENEELRRWSLEASGPKQLADKTLSRWTAAALIERDFELAISNQGALAGFSFDELTTENGDISFRRFMINEFAWSEDMLVAALSGPRTANCRDCEALLFIDPRPAPEHSLPAMLTIDLDQLLPSSDGSPPSMHEFATSSAGVFLTLDNGRGLRTTLVRLTVPIEALLATPLYPEEDEYDAWGGEVTRSIANSELDATRRPLEELQALPGFDLRVIGQLPALKQLTVAPDGTWIAWWEIGEETFFYAAPITKSGLGEPQRLHTLAPGASTLSHTASFTPDAAKVLLNVVTQTELGNASYMRWIALNPL